MLKFYFYYYSFNGIVCSGKRTEDTPKSPGTVKQWEISESEYGLLLADLEHVYSL